MTMNIQNYNEELKHHYRTLALACYDALGDEASQAILDMVKLHKLTERDDVTAEWLRFRVYAVQQHKTLQQWIGKAAYYVLLSKPSWQPSTDCQWFAMLGNFIREQGGDKPTIEALEAALPTSLDNAIGKQWLQVCLDHVHDKQLMNEPPTMDRLQTLNAVSELPRTALVLKLLMGLNLVTRSPSLGVHLIHDDVVFVETRDLCRLLELDNYNKNAMLSLRVMTEQGFVLRLATDKNGDPTDSKKPTNLYYALAANVQAIFD